MLMLWLHEIPNIVSVDLVSCGEHLWNDFPGLRRCDTFGRHTPSTRGASFAQQRSNITSLTLSQFNIELITALLPTA